MTSTNYFFIHHDINTRDRPAIIYFHSPPAVPIHLNTTTKSHDPSSTLHHNSLVTRDPLVCIQQIQHHIYYGRTLWMKTSLRENWPKTEQKNRALVVEY